MFYNLHEITTTKTTNHKLFYINIDKNGDRDKRFQANLKKMVKYNVERFEGSNVKKMKPQDYLSYFTNKAINDAIRGYKLRDEDLTYGGMGCALSHIRLWQKLVDNVEIDHFIIFEDDIVVNDTFIDTMLNTYNKIKDTLDSDIDLLTFTLINRRNEDKLTTNIPGIYKRDHFWGLCAYIINRKCAENLLKNIFPLNEQIDSYISYQIHRKNLNVYSSDLNIIEMDYSVALASQTQTICVECNDGISLWFIDWTLPINLIIIIGFILYSVFKYLK